MRVIGFRDKEVDSLVLDCRDLLRWEELSFEPNEACKHIMSDYIFVLPIKLFVKKDEEVNIENAVKNLRDGDELDLAGFFHYLRELVDISQTEKGFGYVEKQVRHISDSLDLYYPYGNSVSVYLVPKFQKEVEISEPVFQSSLQTIKIKKEKTPFLVNGKNQTVVTVENAGMEPVKQMYKSFDDRDM